MGSDVQAHLPAFLNSDGLMEALIKIRIAQSSGAKSVRLISPVPIGKIELHGQLKEIKGLELEKLFRASGKYVLEEDNFLTPLLKKWSHGARIGIMTHGEKGSAPLVNPGGAIEHALLIQN